MASTTAFDELNILKVDDKAESAIKSHIRQYIEEMELPSDEKERRISLAIDLEKMFRNLFLITLAMSALDKPLESESEYLKDYTYRNYMEVVRKHRLSDADIQNIGKNVNSAVNSNGGSSNIDDDVEVDGYVANYARQTTSDIVDTTILHEADAYYTSLQRSVFLGENEANALANYEKEQKAIKDGYTKKMWLTKKDKKVRHSHVLVDNEVVGIFDTFCVGNSEMLFPKDISNVDIEAKEVVNCRCVCKYLK